VVAIVAGDDPAGRAWLWSGKDAPPQLVSSARDECLRMLAGGDGEAGGGGSQRGVDLVHDGWEPSVMRAVFVDWLTPCGTEGKLREGDQQLAVGTSQLAKKAGAIMANSAPAPSSAADPSAAPPSAGGYALPARGRGDGAAAGGGGGEEHGVCLVRLRGRKIITAVEVPVVATSVNASDVFILNQPAGSRGAGSRPAVYQRNGSRVTPQVSTPSAISFVESRPQGCI